MAISEEVRRKVWERDAGECQLFHTEPVPATEIAHIRHQGMGGDSPDSPLNQPDNLILVCHACHMKLHGRGAYRITRWIPGDPEGLEVVSCRGKPVPKDRLWYYCKRMISLVRDTMNMAMLQSIQARANLWALAAALYELHRANRLLPTATSGSCADVYDFGADLGYTSAEVKRMIRCARFVRERGIEDFQHLPFEVVDLARRHPDRAKEILDVATSVPPPEFWRWVEAELRKARKRKGWIGTGEIRRVEIDPEGKWEDEVPPGAWVLKGGSLVRGIRKEEV